MDQPHRLIIVRRDSSAILSAILRCPDRWPPRSAVMLDRRVRDQPVSTDRREGGRRTPPDPMWLRQGFMVVHVEYLPPEAIVLDDVSARAGVRSLA